MSATIQASLSIAILKSIAIIQVAFEEWVSMNGHADSLAAT